MNFFKDSDPANQGMFYGKSLKHWLWVSNVIKACVYEYLETDVYDAV
jgi:hypothetical protein